MTLEPYNPERLDALALRMLDICAKLRGAAQIARDEQLASLSLHDRKALEWLARLEEWAIAAESDARKQAQIERGARRAERLQKRAD
jgi:hypothetical protein